MRILIFEDNKKFRESLEFLVVTADEMELCGSFADTTSLRQRVGSLQPDVILMDINIEPLSGIDAVRLIKTEFPAARVCMQTVFEDEDKIYASLCAGASGYILKNSAPEKVIQAIKEVAGGGAFFTPSIANKVLANFKAAPINDEALNLSEKEKAVLRLLVEGHSYKMIAAELGISFHTAHTHVGNIYEKMHVSSKGEAVSKAIRNRLV